MVRKKNRKEVDLKTEATCSFINSAGVECFLLKNNDGYFGLSPEQDKWIAIPKWAYEKYSVNKKES